MQKYEQKSLISFFGIRKLQIALTFFLPVYNIFWNWVRISNNILGYFWGSGDGF